PTPGILKCWGQKAVSGTIPVTRKYCGSMSAVRSKAGKELIWVFRRHSRPLPVAFLNRAFRIVLCRCSPLFLLKGAGFWKTDSDALRLTKRFRVTRYSDRHWFPMNGNQPLKSADGFGRWRIIMDYQHILFLRKIRSDEALSQEET